MTTSVLVTIDTELSAGRQARGWDARANYDSSYLGRTPAGGATPWGVPWLIERMDASGVRGVFFVDPMPALVHGRAIVADMVGPILAAGHEVQLHIHTEWLEWATESPVGGRQGRNIGDFSLSDQVTLLALARDLLVEAGAPAPVAFRAGNFGADDRTLRALARLGIGWDSSLNAAYQGGACRIAPTRTPIAIESRDGVTLLPVSGLYDRPGHFRPAQVCAMSRREMRIALEHAVAAAHPAFMVVTHSFEMLSRDRARPNHAVAARFEALCRRIAALPEARSTGFEDLALPADVASEVQPRPLRPDAWRTAQRQAAQMLATWRYERRLTPA